MKKTLLIIFIILLGISLFIFGPSWNSTKEQRAKVTDKINSIEIDVKGINTTIITRNQDYIEAKLKGKGGISLSQKRNTIEIEYERPLFRFFNIFKRRN